MTAFQVPLHLPQGSSAFSPIPQALVSTRDHQEVIATPSCPYSAPQTVPAKTTACRRPASPWTLPAARALPTTLQHLAHSHQGNLRHSCLCLETPMKHQTAQKSQAVIASPSVLAIAVIVLAVAVSRVSSPASPRLGVAGTRGWVAPLCFPCLGVRKLPTLERKVAIASLSSLEVVITRHQRSPLNCSNDMYQFICILQTCANFAI